VTGEIAKSITKWNLLRKSSLLCTERDKKPFITFREYTIRESFELCGMLDQNRRQKVFNRGALRFCGGAWHSKNWQNLNWFTVFHVTIWGGLELCLGGAKPQKPSRSDGTVLDHATGPCYVRFCLSWEEPSLGIK